MESRLEATLEEAARVRADFGYPIMVTPLSQFVVSQAAINVIVGERYKEVTDQVIQYALGLWGAEAPSLMAADVKDKILSRSRARDWQDWQPPDLSLRELRNKFGSALSDEELLLRVYAGEDAVKALPAADSRQYLNAKQPLVRLIEELSRKKDCREISILRPGFSLTLGKAPSERL
jgi:oxaloacetate decarboxylase alpha subunit